VAIVGDAAQTTHPAGATGMNLAISGAARLADAVAPALLANGPSKARDRGVDAALAAFEAERRPAAAAAVAENHRQAMRIWEPGVERDPAAYAAALNPLSGWGVGGAGWGQDPAALGTH
jgi:2-polyprenyl-6-methoxyphenol hydroxylase-like FAD-dependent oxidoreductase